MSINYIIITTREAVMTALTLANTSAPAAAVIYKKMDGTLAYGLVDTTKAVSKVSAAHLAWTAGKFLRDRGNPAYYATAPTGITWAESKLANETATVKPTTTAATKPTANATLAETAKPTVPATPTETPATKTTATQITVEVVGEFTKAKAAWAYRLTSPNHPDHIVANAGLADKATDSAATLQGLLEALKAIKAKNATIEVAYVHHALTNLEKYISRNGNGNNGKPLANATLIVAIGDAIKAAGHTVNYRKVDATALQDVRTMAASMIGKSI